MCMIIPNKKNYCRDQSKGSMTKTVIKGKCGWLLGDVVGKGKYDPYYTVLRMYTTTTVYFLKHKPNSSTIKALP